MAALPRVRASNGWLSVDELLPLLWPLGEHVPGVQVGGARELLVPAHVPSRGRRLLVGRGTRGETVVALGPVSATQHLAVIGPTGSGKSAVLTRAVLDDVAAGYGGAVIDPSGRFFTEVLDRIPAADADRVAVLDLAAGGPVPGLHLFGSGDPELRCDVILYALRSVSLGWGPRIERLLALGLRSVAELPAPSLSSWLALYNDPGLRRQVIGKLDPIRQAEWAAWEALSPAAQQEFIGPAASRITALLSRPALRAVLDQPAPKLDVARLLASGGWLLVSTAPGVLGEAAAGVLAVIVTYLLWTAVEARVAIPPERRRPVFFYFDELQSLSGLPVGLERFFERTRGLGCGVTVATQALERLPTSVRASLLGNVASLITFAAGADEARRISRELPGLSARDVQSLGRFEVAARIHADEGVAVVTGRTEPLPPPTGQAEAIRRRSAERYGVDPAWLEAELARRAGPPADEDAVGRRRRQP